MNPEFEQKVNQSYEAIPATVTVAPAPVPTTPTTNSKVNRDFNRKLIFIFVGAIICFALLIIIRGVLLQYPPTFDNSSIIGQLLNPNGVTGLNGLQITEAQAILNDFTAGLKTEYQEFPDNNTRILLLKSETNSTIGRFQIDGKFVTIVQIPNIVNVYRFYNDNTFLYSINSPNISLSELYLNTKDNKPILIKRLEKNQKFIDAHFSILDKTFYYSYYDENNTVYIQATDLKGSDFQLYKTNFLSTDTKIWNIDTTSGFIYLNQKRECFSLQLRDKVLNAYSCEKIKMNGNNNFYWTNESTTGLYTSFDKGEVYRFTFGELERKVLTSKSNGIVVQKPWLSGNELYYITGNLEQVGNTLWNIVPRDIEFINVDNTDQGTFEIKNMRSDIYAIIPMDSLYIITEQFFGKSQLLKYNPNPEIPEPVSYPMSYPGSYPASYTVESINPQEYYWEKVDLSMPYSTVEIIQPQYTYNF